MNRLSIKVLVESVNVRPPFVNEVVHNELKPRGKLLLKSTNANVKKQGYQVAALEEPLELIGGEIPRITDLNGIRIMRHILAAEEDIIH